MRHARTLSPARRNAAGPLLACALAFLQSCALFGSGDPGITFATDPPGARILVDGRDSGFVTPCRIALETGETYQVEMRLDGYVPARVRLESTHHKEIILWKDMYVSPAVWRFPLWLNMKDSLQPFVYESTLEPARIHARLERAADPLARSRAEPGAPGQP